MMTTMMPTLLDHDYYEWLISEIAIPNGKTYNHLFEIMHNTEFVWTIPNDDNRLQDGLSLRIEFLNGRGRALDLQGATLLEVLVSLSRRVAFIAGSTPRKWAWRLLKNLRLHTKSDPLTESDVARINDVLDALIWRTYDADGRGGFFPLSNPKQDQTKVEIWYQMNQYVIERSP